jgi:hypothetical protein
VADLFRTRGASSQVFRTSEGASKRAAFENAHPRGKRPWTYTVRRCDNRGVVHGQGHYFKLVQMRDIPHGCK